jgi:predicted transcriptional regulator
MLSGDFISHEIPALKLSDSIKQVLIWMDEHHVLHLPVFAKGVYQGVISESDLLNHQNTEDDLSSLEDNFLKVSVSNDKSIYDVIKTLDDYKLSLVPVIDPEGSFKGTISYKEVMSAMVRMLNLNSAGGVFVLEMNYVDYSLAEISRLIESNDARVLSSHISFHHNSQMVDVVIKVNTDSIGSILQTLERYDYVVKAKFQDTITEDPENDRYDALMRYLNT